MKKRVIAAATAGFLLFGGVAFAEGRYKTIEVFFDRIQVNINGQKTELSKDSLIYEGSVYIPLRNLAELLSAQVSWDSANRAVNLDFINDKLDAVSESAKKGLYQYVSIENNRIMSSLIEKLGKEDYSGMADDIAAVDKLRRMASDMQDTSLYAELDKIKLSLELLKSGLQAKKLDDYSLAWSIFSTSEKNLLELLKKGLAGK